MIYVTKSFYSKEACRRFSFAHFVFGDNQERVGTGGQAIIRGQPNAVGIATKRSCSEYMTGTLADFEAVLRDIRNLEFLLPRNVVVFPVLDNGNTSLGCGLADLPNRAPHLYGMINDWFLSLPDKKESRL